MMILQSDAVDCGQTHNSGSMGTTCVDSRQRVGAVEENQSGFNKRREESLTRPWH